MANETNTPAIREFGEYDWLGFAGAEGWGKKSQPLTVEAQLADGREFMLIADKTGMELFLNCMEESSMQFNVNVALPTQAAARLVMEALVAKGTLEAFQTFGFAEL